MRLIDFQLGPPSAWTIVNDGVMGGLSSSDLTAEVGSAAVFQGRLSLENNGGFASVRMALPGGALARAASIALRVRGDGRRYQLRLRPGGSVDGPAWAADFETTPSEWVTVTLPVNAFEPRFRGSRPPDAGPLALEHVGQLGFMLADKHEGAFRLEILWIDVNPDGAGP